MKYCIDQDSRRIIIHLEPVDSLSYTNVPLARAILRARSELRIEKRYLKFEMNDNYPQASYTVQMESEMNDLAEIKQVHRATQKWLSEQISRLKAMKVDMDILKEAEYAHGNAKD